MHSSIAAPAALALVALSAASIVDAAAAPQQANTFVTAPSPWHDPEESPFPPTIGPGATVPTAPAQTSSRSSISTSLVTSDRDPTVTSSLLTIETINPSPSTITTSPLLPLYPTFPGYRPGSCACYTHTTTIPNPTCLPSSQTCGPHPDCIIDYFETLPPHDAACPLTPTVTKTATACSNYCQTGCASGTSTGTGCTTRTTTVFPIIACPAAPSCPPPKCYSKSIKTVGPSYCGCRTAPTSTYFAAASDVCTTTCPTGCLKVVETVTSSLT